MIFKALFILLLCSVVIAGAPRWPSPWEDAISSFAADSERPMCRTRFPLDEDSLHDYDAITYETNLSIDLNARTIASRVGVLLRAEDTPLSFIHVRLTHELTIDSVTSPNAINTVQHLPSDSVIIELTQPLAPGDSTWIWFAYHGTPGNIDAWGGMFFANPQVWRPQICWTMGDGLALDPPPSNYAWLPSFADPTDKVTWETWIRVPTGRTVSSGGDRIDTVANDDGTTTWHYRLPEPVSTYLLFLAVSDYTIFQQRESNPRIEHFVYPTRMAAAQVHFENLPAVLDGFVERFGPYPFNRMGFAMTRNGDMEHATCVSHYDAAVVSSHQYDWLLFHEMSHQWWGDWVTLGDWRDLWLNEGFATYCEALGMEVLGGAEAYHDYVVSDLYATALGANESYSIYDPDVYWGATVYQKGACVMHMLRQVMGDSLFFGAWRDYGQQYAYASAVTADWQRVCEDHYGGSLDWFFQPWVYGTRYPRYRVTSTISDIFEVRVEQIQTTGTLFRMPVELELIGHDSATARITIWTEAEAVSFDSMLLPSDSVPFFPARVGRFDPDDKILKTVEYEVVIAADERGAVLPYTFGITALTPNPFNASTTIAYTLDRSSDVKLKVFDLLGRMTIDLSLGELSPGLHETRLDLAAFASGIYLVSLETPYAVRTAKAVLLK